MHPLTCYAGQISLCHAKMDKISKKFFVMINKDGGEILGFYGGGHSCYEGGGKELGKTLVMVDFFFVCLLCGTLP